LTLSSECGTLARPTHKSPGGKPIASETAAPQLGFWQKALYSAGSIGLNMISLSVSSWLLYFYVPPSDRTDLIAYAPASLVGAIT
jgi:hypothetical protein